MFRHFHTMLPQNPDTFSMYQRVRVLRTNHHSADSGGKQGIGTRRLFSVVAARLQCDINGCPFGRFGTMCQRIPLRMQLSVPFVISFPDNFFIFYDHGSHQRIRGYPSRSLFRQFECSPHISFICHKFLHTTKSPGQFLLRASFGCVLLLGLLLENKKALEMNSRANIPISITAVYGLLCFYRLSSFIQTVLSASELHRIMPCGSWAVPPVGNCTLP